MSKPKTLIYAELLSNIRQISVIAALDVPCDGTTKAELSGDRQQIILDHQGKTTTLKLPGQVASNAQLQKPALGKKEVSWRLPLVGQSSRAEVESAQNIEAPWPAKALGRGVEVLCRECRTIIVKKESIKIWKDLPSENWAEMMEFWHCHKPDDEPIGSSGHVRVEGPIATKGYGANTKFLATPGVGFVDITTFLLSDSDCPNTQFIPSSDTTLRHQSISCVTCNNYIGRIDHQASGLRLYKWRLTLSTTSPASVNTIAGAQVLSSQLSSLMASQCTSRLLLIPLQWTPPSNSLSKPSSPKACPVSSGTPSSSTTPSLPYSVQTYTKSTNGSMLLTESKQHSSAFSFISLWILAPSIRFSATTSSYPQTKESGEGYDGTLDGQLAMKVFWQMVSVEEAIMLMDKEGVEEVALPQEVIIEIEGCLRTSAGFLPPSARKFQEWEVGLLERYEQRSM